MTLKIEKYSDAGRTTIRLIGRMQQEHLEELKSQMKDGGPSVALDLEQVILVDVVVVRFLGVSKASGVGILHCPQYVQEWIAKEWDRKG